MTREIYYALRPLIPRSLQIFLRRQRVNHLYGSNRDRWPIWEPADAPPPAAPRWPDGKKFALALTHDVESEYGLSRCLRLADLEEERGFRSTFAFVPRRYSTPKWLRHSLTERGFSIMVHDLFHDGKLFRSRRLFDRRRQAINDVLERWETRGFASAATLHNLEWMCELNIDYSISTCDSDPFEPQGCGLGRIFPFWVGSPGGKGRGFVEIPYTLPQDFTVCILMGDRSDAVWRKKLDWIAEKGGVAVIKTHPDYMFFQDRDKRQDRYAASIYSDFLDYVRSRYRDDVWVAHPSEIANHWRLNTARENESDAIPFRSTFCATCRQAHASGWLRQYPAAEAAHDPLGEFVGKKTGPSLLPSDRRESFDEAAMAR